MLRTMLLSYSAQVCADKIASDPETYCDAILGMPNAAYCEWITNPFNWGGEVRFLCVRAHACAHAHARNACARTLVGGAGDIGRVL